MNMLQYLQAFLHTLTSWSVYGNWCSCLEGSGRDHIQMCSGEASYSGVSHNNCELEQQHSGKGVGQRACRWRWLGTGSCKASNTSWASSGVLSLWSPRFLWVLGRKVCPVDKEELNTHIYLGVPQTTVVLFYHFHLVICHCPPLLVGGFTEHGIYLNSSVHLANVPKDLHPDALVKVPTMPKPLCTVL